MDGHSGIYRVGFPLVGILLFLITLIQSKPTLKVPLILPVFAFVIISTASSIYNGLPIFNWAFFLLYTLVSSYFYFLVILNEKDDKLISRVSKFVVLLVLVQIPVVLIKYKMLGQTESGAIGTLSVRAGSVSTVFPALVVAFLASFYLYTKRNICIFLIVMFGVFGIIGGKRAIVFLLPAEMLLAYILYLGHNKTEMSRRVIANGVVVSLVSLLLVCMTIKLIPTLNPERSTWGSIDIPYVLEYTEGYLDSGYFEGNPGATLQEIRRMEGIYYFANLLMSYEYANIMLGDGAGKLVQSRYTESSGEMIDVYGVRYGGRMGLIWLMMQIGILGVAAHLCIHIQLFRQVYKRRGPPERYHEALRLGFVVASAVLFLDFAIYSVTSVQIEAVKGMYFFVAAILYRRVYVSRRTPVIGREPAMMYARS